MNLYKKKKVTASLLQEDRLPPIHGMVGSKNKISYLQLFIFICKCILLSYILFESVVIVGHGRPVGTRNPYGHGFAWVMGFLISSYNFYRHEFRIVKSSGFVPVAILTYERTVQLNNRG